MNKLKLIALAILPSILLFLAWPPRDFFFLSFLAFVPFFILENKLRGKKGFFWLLYLGLFLFNLFNTWWVWYASNEGSIVMLMANSLLMTVPFVFYRKAVRAFGESRALFAFVCYWIGFEYLHLSWEITWPWLSLGNLFAKHNEVVQWYEITGMLGGSLWVLIVNVLVYKLILFKKRKFVYQLSFTLLLPVLSSIILGVLFQKEFETVKVSGEETIIVQPNIDPYKKFNPGMATRSVVHMLELIEAQIGPNTSYVILPETAIVEYVDEDHLNDYESIKLINQFLKKHPHVHFITGASTYNFYDDDEKRKPTARELEDGSFYESYNTSLEFDSNGVSNIYHKSKLVPGVEKMPYPQIFGFLERWSIDMGGVTGSLGEDASPTVFDAGDKANLAPMICYESVFPGYVREFVAKGASILLVMTNDGWWEDTDGYKQHMYYACLRAIENRRQVLRSANTGISCQIDASGKILERTKWWEESSLKVIAIPSYKETFYARNGDYIGKFASFFSVLLILGAFVKSRVKH